MGTLARPRSAIAVRHIVHGDGYAIVVIGFLLASLGIAADQTVLPAIGCAIAILGLLRAQWQALLVLSYPIIGLGGAMISNIFIEQGAYITEQFRSGSYIGSTGALALFYIGFLTVAHFTIVIVTRRFFGRLTLDDVTLARLRMILIIGLAAALLGYAAIITIYDSAWTFSGARFEFWRVMPPIIANPMKLIHYYALPAAVALAGFFFVVNQKRRGNKLLIMLLVLVAPALFATGEKMSAFMLMATYLATGIGIGGIGRGIHKAVTGWIILAAALTVAALLWSTSLGYEALGVNDTAEAILGRSVLQGHVWWGIYGLAEPDQGIVPIGELIRPDVYGAPGGLNRLAYLISPTDFLRPRILQGIGFTMGGSATAIAAFGILPGFFVYMFAGTLYGLAAWVVAVMLHRGLIVFAGVALAFVFIVHQVTQMGNWDFLYHPISLAFYIVLVVAAVKPTSGHNQLTRP